MSLGNAARSRISGTVASSSLAVASLFIAQPAQAQAGAIQGGSGGHYFEYACPPGQMLTGLRGSAGVLIDAIQPICSSLAQGDLTMGENLGPVLGSDRPMDKWAQCSGRYGVSSLLLAMNDDHPQLGALRIICTELINRDHGGTKDLLIAGSGNLEGYDSPLLWNPSTPGFMKLWSDCPGGWAVGIRGRSDRYVDALGLICGPKPAVTDPNANAGHTLGKRKKPTLDMRRDSDDSYRSSIPQTGRTLGKRKKRPPEITGGAGSEANPNPMPEQPALTDGQIGVSLNSDGGVPVPPPVATTEPPSPLINGTYATRLTVNDSQCIRDNLRGSWNRNIDLTPRPGILLPLNQFNSMFAGPVMLSVQGLRISQATDIPVNFGFAGTVPSRFEGAFSNDGSRFDLRFEAGNSLCRVSGTIAGQRL